MEPFSRIKDEGMWTQTCVIASSLPFNLKNENGTFLVIKDERFSKMKDQLPKTLVHVFAEKNWKILGLSYLLLLDSPLL